MRPVAAPAGYEGSVSFSDGTRSWQVSARSVGSTWWTNCGLVGHAQTAQDEVDALAREAIEGRVRLGMVR